jgi:hypothetical protein
MSNLNIDQFIKVIEKIIGLITETIKCLETKETMLLKKLREKLASYKTKLNEAKSAIEKLKDSLEYVDVAKLCKLIVKLEKCFCNLDFVCFESVLEELKKFIEELKKRNHTRNGIQKKPQVKKPQSKKRT